MVESLGFAGAYKEIRGFAGAYKEMRGFVRASRPFSAKEAFWPEGHMFSRHQEPRVLFMTPSRTSWVALSRSTCFVWCLSMFIYYPAASHCRAAARWAGCRSVQETWDTCGTFCLSWRKSCVPLPKLRDAPRSAVGFDGPCWELQSHRYCSN